MIIFIIQFVYYFKYIFSNFIFSFSFFNSSSFLDKKFNSCSKLLLLLSSLDFLFSSEFFLEGRNIKYNNNIIKEIENNIIISLFFLKVKRLKKQRLKKI